jgi:hypothetical protein
VDDVDEQATGARTALHSLSHGKIFTYPSGEVSLLIARGLLTNFSLCSSSFSSVESPRNACTFLSEKSLLGFRGALFYCLSREEFAAVWSEPIVFLFGACGPSGVEGRAREA